MTFLFLNDLRHRANTALSLREPLTRHDLPAAQAVSGKKGLFQGKDYRGVEVLADLRPIPDSPWFMVAKVDTSEILAEAHYRGAVVIIFSGLFILLAAGLTAYGYRHRQAILYQNLYQSEREQRKAEELFRTTLYSIGDAVITTDAKGLVQQMNPVAERLTGWPESEATRKTARGGVPHCTRGISCACTEPRTANSHRGRGGGTGEPYCTHIPGRDRAPNS